MTVLFPLRNVPSIFAEANLAGPDEVSDSRVDDFRSLGDRRILCHGYLSIALIYWAGVIGETYLTGDVIGESSFRPTACSSDLPDLSDQLLNPTLPLVEKLSSAISPNRNRNFEA
jgi:hypothetical protein